MIRGDHCGSAFCGPLAGTAFFPFTVRRLVREAARTLRGGAASAILHSEESRYRLPGAERPSEARLQNKGEKSRAVWTGPGRCHDL